MSVRRRPFQPFSLFSFQDIITSVAGVVILVTLILTLELIQAKRHSVADHTTAVARHLPDALADIQDSVSAAEEQLKQRDAALREAAPLSPRTLEGERLDTDRQIQRLQAELEALEREATHLEQQRAKRVDDRVEQQAAQDGVEENRNEGRAIKGEVERLKNSNRVIYNPSKMSGKHAWLVEIDGSRFMVARAKTKMKPVVFEGYESPTTAETFLTWAAERDRQSEYFVLLIHPSGIEAYQTVQDRLKNLGFDVGFDLLGPEQTAIDLEHGAWY